MKVTSGCNDDRLSGIASENSMTVEVDLGNNQNFSCRCGSLLQLDVQSLNRKLLGSDSKKLYCLSCMADLFECAVEDIVNKLDAFKREGCRLFPVKSLAE